MLSNDEDQDEDLQEAAMDDNEEDDDEEDDLEGDISINETLSIKTRSRITDFALVHWTSSIPKKAIVKRKLS